MDGFERGPFEYHSDRSGLKWEVRYNSLCIGSRSVPKGSTRSNVIETFSDDVSSFIRSVSGACQRNGLYAKYMLHLPRARLVRSTDRAGVPGATIDTFPYACPIEGLQNVLIDNRHRTWLMVDQFPEGFERSSGVSKSMPMHQDVFEAIKPVQAALAQAKREASDLRNRLENQAPPQAWVLTLLPSKVLTLDASEWQAPTSWELRHVVGEGSFTGVTGAYASDLVGLTPQHFRKFMARDGAASQQSIPFAIWHLLLYRLNLR